MYQAIVFLPLLGALIAAFTALVGAHARHPGATAAPGAEDHAHGPVDERHVRAAPSPHAPHAVITHSASEPEPRQPPASGSRFAEIVTTVFLFASMLLSWVAFADIGFAHHDTRVSILPWIVSGDLKIEWAL